MGGMSNDITLEVRWIDQHGDTRTQVFGFEKLDAAVSRAGAFIGEAIRYNELCDGIITADGIQLGHFKSGGTGKGVHLTAAGIERRTAEVRV